MKMIIYNRGKSVVHFRHNLLVFVKDRCEKMESYWVTQVLIWWLKSKVDGLRSKWTVRLVDTNDFKWTFMNLIGTTHKNQNWGKYRFQIDDPKIKKWTAKKGKNS